MKRKLLALLLCVASFACCAFAISACGSNCKAEYSEMTVYEQKQPTCTKNGREYYVYCPRCNKYWTSPGHKHQTTPEASVLKPLGHNYQSGKCIRCGKTDPALLPDLMTIPDIAVSEEGVLSWGEIKIASKYRVEITDGDGTAHSYDFCDGDGCELDLTELSDGLELSYGKNYATITAYKPYSENIDGETIADDIPVTETKTQFIAIKQNSGYSCTKLTYADEYIAINGAYSDMRTEGDANYIVIEQQIAADKQSVSFNLANKVKMGEGCTVTYYKNKEKTESISKENWRFQSVPAGATNFYLSVSTPVGNRDYVVRVLAVKPVQVSLVKAVKSGSQYEFTTLMSNLTVLENDYIDVNMFYANATSTSQVVVDADFNVYKRAEKGFGQQGYEVDDCVMPLCTGKNYTFYLIENSHLEKVQSSLKKYGNAFNCKFVWGDSGFTHSYWSLTLRGDYAKKAVYVPYEFGNGDFVLLTANTLGYFNKLEKVVIGSGHTGISSSVFASCEHLTEVYIPNSAKGGLGDFMFPVALKDTLTVYCEGEIANGNWNKINGTTKYFTTVKNTTLPSYEDIMR